LDFKSGILKEAIISASLVIVLIIVVFVLKSDVENRAGKLVSLRNQINASSMAIGSLAVLQADAEKAKNYIPQISGYLISEDKLISFSKDMDSIGLQNSLSVNVVYGQQVKPTDITPRSTAITLSSISKATLGNFINFLSLIENSYYFVRINTIDINQDAGQMNANLTGQVFSF
jgi:hypothetical protein